MLPNLFPNEFTLTQNIKHEKDKIHTNCTQTNLKDHIFNSNDTSNGAIINILNLLKIQIKIFSDALFHVRIFSKTK